VELKSYHRGAGQKVDTAHNVYPPTKMEKAISVQRRYCGLLSKALAMFIDLLLISIGFAIFIVTFLYCITRC
jgi:hypothetical protein